MTVRAFLSLSVVLTTTGCASAPGTPDDGLTDSDVRDSDEQIEDTDPATDTDAHDSDAGDSDAADTDPTTDTDDSDSPGDTDSDADTDAADTDLPVFRVRISPSHATTLDDLIATVENVPPGTGAPF